MCRRAAEAGVRNRRRLVSHQLVNTAGKHKERSVKDEEHYILSWTRFMQPTQRGTCALLSFRGRWTRKQLQLLSGSLQIA
jgi:hypothetical protein